MVLRAESCGKPLRCLFGLRGETGLAYYLQVSVNRKGGQMEQPKAGDLNAVQLQGLITLAVRNGVLHASAMIALVGLLISLIVALLR